MRFLDPMPYRCPSCDKESQITVRTLLALTACCPGCQASLREIGLRMRRTVDETAAFWNAIRILMHVEQRLGILIRDEAVEAIRPWSDLRLEDLTTAVKRMLPADAAASARESIVTAVRAEYPGAPTSLDFAAPLLDAISSRRGYEGE